MTLPCCHGYLSWRSLLRSCDWLACLIPLYIVRHKQCGYRAVFVARLQVLESEAGHSIDLVSVGSYPRRSARLTIPTFESIITFSVVYMLYKVINSIVDITFPQKYLRHTSIHREDTTSSRSQSKTNTYLHRFTPQLHITAAAPDTNSLEALKQQLADWAPNKSRYIILCMQPLSHTPSYVKQYCKTKLD